MSIESRNNLETQNQPQQKISIAKLLRDITSDGTIDKKDDPNLKLLLDKYNEATKDHKDFLKQSLWTTLNKGFNISDEANYNNIKGLLEKNGLTNGKSLPSFQDVMKLSRNNIPFVIKFNRAKIGFNDKIAFFNDKGKAFGDLDLIDGKFTKSYLIKNDDIKDNNTIQKYNLTPDEQRAENAKNQPSQSTQTPQNSQPQNPQNNQETQNNKVLNINDYIKENFKRPTEYLRSFIGKEDQILNDYHAKGIIYHIIKDETPDFSKMEEVVKSFQKRHRLTVDGKI